MLNWWTYKYLFIFETPEIGLISKEGLGTYKFTINDPQVRIGII